MNKRKLKLDEYGISKKRYKELCGFCEQYPEWKEKLANESFLRSLQYGDEPQPSNHNNSDTTAAHAIRLLKYKKNIELIEKVAKQADAAIWQYLIKSACYEVPIQYLISYWGLPMESNAFYTRRRYFFYLLDQEKNKE